MSLQDLKNRLIDEIDSKNKQIPLRRQFIECIPDNVPYKTIYGLFNWPLEIVLPDGRYDSVPQEWLNYLPYFGYAELVEFNRRSEWTHWVYRYGSGEFEAFEVEFSQKEVSND